MIKLQDVSKWYQSNNVLTSLDLVINAHQNTILIGPSGCGKSTILRLIAGLIEPDRGEIQFENTLLELENINAIRRRMGYVIQEGGLFPHLNAYDNVAIMARHLKWPTQRITKRISELLELVQLDKNLLHRYPAELSGGQRQRVSLMRALMLDPDVLLLDEPLGALDPMIRYELQQQLKGIFDTLNKTVVMVTHDMAEAAYFGHTLVLMRDGRIVQQGSVQQLMKYPIEPFVEQFISAQINPMRQLINVAP